MARRQQSKRDELGFFPFFVSDDCGEYGEGYNTPEEATEAARQMLSDDNVAVAVIYQAIKKVEAVPVECEVTGVSF